MRHAVLCLVVVVSLVSVARARKPRYTIQQDRWSDGASTWRVYDRGYGGDVDPWQVWRANRAYTARQYGQQGGAGWNQSYWPGQARPYYQTLPGWQVMPSLPDSPNYGAGNW